MAPLAARRSWRRGVQIPSSEALQFGAKATRRFWWIPAVSSDQVTYKADQVRPRCTIRFGR